MIQKLKSSIGKLIKRGDAWFTVRGPISKTGMIFLGMGILLTFISFYKGIQVLMFIPAFGLALFLYSFIDIFLTKRACSVSWKIIDGELILHIEWKKEREYSYFRIAEDDGDDVRYLIPDKSLSLPSGEEKVKILFVLQGRLDIFRSVITLPSVPRAQPENIRILETRECADEYFHVRPLQPGDNVARIDYLQTAKRGEWYVKEVVPDMTKGDEKHEKKLEKLRMRSDLPLTLRNDLSFGPVVEWSMILLGVIAASFEWRNPLFSFVAFLMFGVNLLWTKKLHWPLGGRKMMNFIVLLVFIGCVVESGFKGDPVESGVHFLLLLAVMKHFFLRERRDAFFFIFLVLFVFVALSLFTLRGWFGIFFLVYLLQAIALFSIYASGEEGTEYSSSFGREKTKRSYIGMNFAVIGLTIVLFFFLPHGTYGENRGPQLRKNIPDKVGFSDTVSLNDIRQMKMNYAKQIVIENISQDSVPYLNSLYWRGMRYDRFSGGNWEKMGIENFIPYEYDSYHASATETETWTIKYYLDSQKHLFLPKIPLSINERDVVKLTPDRSVAEFKEPKSKALDVAITFETDGDGEITDSYSPVPKMRNGISPDIDTLLQSFWQSIPDSVEKTPEGLEKYIREDAGFTYSLEDPAPNLPSFLYEKKQGHCEYFATVLAVTLQHFGYSATLVNGFTGGEWNEEAGAWIIRGSHAHSWVEVLDETGKWERFDPTPPSIPVSFWFEDAPVLGTLLRYYDVFELKWFENIVGYTGLKQKALWSFLKDRTAVILISLCVLTAGIFSRRYYRNVLSPYLRLTPKEKFLRWLSGKTGRESFVLSGFEKTENALTHETREVLFRNPLEKESLKHLREQWKSALERAKSHIPTS